MTNFEKEVKRLMATGLTEAEARELAAYDAEVDSGKATEYDLTPEQQKVAKNYTTTHTKTVYNFTKRERKPNETKRWIMRQLKVLFEGMAANGNCEAVNLSNIERTLDFSIDNRQFTLTLTEHRAKKE